MNEWESCSVALECQHIFEHIHSHIFNVFFSRICSLICKAGYYHKKNRERMKRKKKDDDLYVKFWLSYVRISSSPPLYVIFAILLYIYIYIVITFFFFFFFLSCTHVCVCFFLLLHSFILRNRIKQRRKKKLLRSKLLAFGCWLSRVFFVQHYCVFFRTISRPTINCY